MAQLAKECCRCVRIVDGRCVAIAKPREIWAEGGCWARTEDKGAVVRAMDDIQRYALLAPKSRGGAA